MKKFAKALMAICLIACICITFGACGSEERDTTAYDLWLVQGHIGSEEDFLEWIKTGGGSRRVILIGVDGFGSNESAERTPKIHTIFEGGTTTHSMTCVSPTYSAQNWGSMLTGVMPDVHKMSNEVLKKNANDSGDLPTIFKQIRNVMPRAELASFCGWGAINHGIVENDIGVHKYNSLDINVRNKAMAYLDSCNPTFMYVHFDNVDYEGELNGFGSDQYFDAITVVDGYVERIYNKIVERGWADDTLFIVCADHGGLGFLHGGESDAEKYVFFGAVGKDVNIGTVEEMYVYDIPLIITTYLGIQPASNWIGACPQGIFN